MNLSKIAVPFIKALILIPLFSLTALADDICTQTNPCNISIENNTSKTLKLTAKTWNPCVGPFETSGLKYAIVPSETVNWKVSPSSQCSADEIRLSVRYLYDRRAIQTNSCVISATLAKGSEGYTLTSTAQCDPAVKVTPGSSPNSFVISE